MMAAACGGDRPGATAPPRPVVAPGAVAAVGGNQAGPTVPSVRLELPPAPAGARTIGVRLDGEQARAAIGVDGTATVVLAASAADVALAAGDQVGNGRLTLTVPASDAALPAVLAAEGPLVAPEVIPVHVGLGGMQAPRELIIDRSPDASQFAAVRAGVWRLPGEQAATSGGLIDLVDGGAFYQGSAGPLSHARYVALTRAVAGPAVACGGAEVGTFELDVTVFDRFAGHVAGKQRFRPTTACAAGAGPLRVEVATVRHWLRAQFVRTDE